jgi:hypothetical protein
MTNKLIQITLLAILTALAGCSTPKVSGRLATYYDTRGMPTATLTVGARSLPADTNFFGFVDVDGDERANISKTYGEFMLSKKADNGIGAAIEHNYDFLKQEGVTRPGIIYEPPLTGIDNTFVGVKFFPDSFPDQGMQVGVYGSKEWNDGDITLNFWGDYNFTSGTSIGDIQVGKRLVKSVYLVIEGRYSGFNHEEPFSLGIGLEGRF